MKLLTHLLICIFFLSSINTLLSQNKAKSIDTLKNKTAQELFYISARSPDISILEKAIKKAKEENNMSVLINSYNYMALRLKDENKLLYSDSIIALKDTYSNSFYPASAYYNKGFYFFNNGNFIKATDNFIKANEYANRYYNKDMIVRSKQSLGLLKKETGDYKQALTLYKENFEFATSGNTNTLSNTDYLEIILSIASTYNELNNYDSISYYNDFGIKESLRLKDTTKYNDFILNEAKALFNKEKYDRSLNNLIKILPYYKSSNDHANLSFTYYYLAKNYLKLKEDKIAIQFLKKVDSLYIESNDARPKTKVQESYALLTSYYRDQKQLEDLIIYQDKTIALTNKLHANELYTNKKIVNDYDIPLILANTKKAMDKIKAKEKRTKLLSYFLVVIIIAILIILFYLNTRRKVYKKIFEELISKKDDTLNLKSIKKEKPSTKTTLNIPDTVVSKILTSLEKFEKDKEYLNSKISIAGLAKSIGTNPNYLSKTVNHFKEMSFSQYINTLRITYAVSSLKNDSIYRKYTLKAIAAEFGFNNTESFSKAFYKETGIKPSFFMRSIEKTNT
ncbi:AraC family transcriptional regulator [uncultured Dokdonia sp.]|uniref:AraC family transcriptional regulator n=1 Tax=uncultured Dokdonia sp. TaxID=575653 RepID=UPI00261F1B22|nr:AraC family transcriptional regulator [uncultured Dokdonia sp.]